MKPERLGDMLIFAKVVELGSFTLAADALELSKGAVSKAVTRLEDYLGLRLLQRTTRRMTVTLDGQVFYEYCEKIVAQSAAAENHLGSLRDTPRGLVRITAPVTYGSIRLAPLIARLLNQYPQLEVELVLDDKPIELIDGNIDIAVRCGPLPDSGMIARRVSYLPYSLVCTPGYLEGRELPRHPKQLMSNQCLVVGLYPDRAHWHFVEQGSDLYVPVSGRLKVNSSQALVNALKQGLGIGMVPRYQVAQELDAGSMIELLADFIPPPSPVYLVYPHRRHMNAAVKTTLEFFHQNIEHP